MLINLSDYLSSRLDKIPSIKIASFSAASHPLCGLSKDQIDLQTVFAQFCPTI